MRQTARPNNKQENDMSKFDDLLDGEEGTALEDVLQLSEENVTEVQGNEENEDDFDFLADFQAAVSASRFANLAKQKAPARPKIQSGKPKTERAKPEILPDPIPVVVLHRFKTIICSCGTQHRFLSQRFIGYGMKNGLNFRPYSERGTGPYDQKLREIAMELLSQEKLKIEEVSEAVEACETCIV
jgi:hypothetical protein